MLPSSCRALWSVSQSVREPAREDVSRQVCAPLTAERTLRNDPGVRRCSDWGRYGLGTALAADGEVTEP